MPLPSCSGLIESAVRRLPPEARGRYRREFLTELDYLTNSERIFYACTVRFRAAALNRAISSVGEFEPDLAGDDRPRAPLHCRAHLWHHWVTEHQPGVTFVVCGECGRLAGRTIFDPVLP
jgi:hypothetical protein